MDTGIVPEEIIGILKTLNRHGYDAYLAGGCVRDMVMGRQIHDWDAATSAPAEVVADIFPDTIGTGIKYGTVTVFSGTEKAEVTTFRSDGEYVDRRRPENVRFVSSIEEDLQRRDFTINAMALSASGELIDLHGGIDDIHKRVIRCVGEPEKRFSEDALRMFRAIRFSSQLGFDISPETLSAIRTCAPGAHQLSGERVFAETNKVLMSDRPEILALAMSMGLYEGISSGADMQMLLRLRELDAQQRWCGFCAVLNAHGYDAAAFLQRLRASKKLVGSCTSIPAPEREQGFASGLGIKRLLSKYGAEKVICAAGADFVVNGRQSVIAVRQILDSGQCFSIGQLKINGSDLLALGAEPGKYTGELLRTLLEHVILHPQDNDKTTLMELAEKIIENY